MTDSDILLGEFKEFKKHTSSELADIKKKLDSELSYIKTKLEDLSRFQWKFAGSIMTIVFLLGIYLRTRGAK